MFVRSHFPNVSRRSAGFTLIELLMVIMIIGILSSFVLVALAGVNQTAKEDRTTAQIMKIHELIAEKWETYAHRRLPNVSPKIIAWRQQGKSASLKYKTLAADRLMAARDLLRLELPDQKEDVIGLDGSGPRSRLLDPLTSTPSSPKPYVPALARGYYNRALRATNGDVTQWSAEFEGAECLYLILSQMRDRDSSALEFFAENEIGDFDGDGMKEILDGWGQPIRWIRWAPGFVSTMQVSLAENPAQEDLFDPMRVGSGYETEEELLSLGLPRALYPLIFSAGPDQKYGIQGFGSAGTWFAVRSDPYHPSMRQVGASVDAEDVEQAADNITNHLLATR